MSNYSIGLSGLQTTSNAMDVVSNNIANSSTVGYRAGEYIFEDQFYKALNPMDIARSGMGSAKQNIRKIWNMGSIQASGNSLDMAITGAAGMFRLTAAADDPSQTYYTRNGQFAISKETDPSYPKRSYIVNENGMFLTGYSSVDGIELSSSHNNRITMPPVTIDPVTTSQSTVSVTLDARKTSFLPEGNLAFDPNTPSTYNNKISQTVYHLGDSGNPHTMSLYYRRSEDKNMDVIWDGTYLKYAPSSVADPKATTVEKGGVVENNSSYVVLSPDSSGPNFQYLTSADRKTNVIFGDGSSAGNADYTAGKYINVNLSKDVSSYARVILNGRDTGAVVLPTASQSSGACAIDVTTPANATTDPVTPEVSTATLSGSFKAGDLVSLKVAGKTYTHLVTAEEVTTAAGDDAALCTAIADELATKITLDDAALGLASAEAADGVITFTGADGNSNKLSISVSINKALQLSDVVSVPNNAEVMFFNPVTKADLAPPAATGTTTKTVTLTAADQSVQVGQYAWKVTKTIVDAADPTQDTYTYERLDAKIIEVNNKGITLDTDITLNGEVTTPGERTNDDVVESLVFYQPVTYSVMLQDGSKVAVVGEHKSMSTSSISKQHFTAVTSQVEVYGSLDGTMYNGGDPRFSSDTDITASVPGTYKPIATLQFWGGHNIDAIRFDDVTGQPAYQSTVQLKGIVTSSGKTMGRDATATLDEISASDNHPLEFNLDLTGTQHYATSFSVDANYQNGSPTSMLNTVTIDDAGKIVGVYSDGREFLAGQVALVYFPASNGLVPMGNNVFQASYMSGNEINENVIIGKPGERGLGGIRSSAVEGSNVDLANELVKLLIMQRMYSANSQAIRAFDDTLTTTIRMTGG